MEFSSKAVVVNKFGSYDCLSVNKFPLGTLDDKIEVDVSFGGLNFADLYTRLGLFSNRKLPFVLGIECAGVITNIGSNIKEECSLKIGQRVICFDHNAGLFQDKIRISPNNVYPLADHVPFDVGAVLFVNYLTAYFALFEFGNLKPNETIFISSCAGGVGIAATQLARTVNNVAIIGTASENKETYLKQHGVDYVLNYDNLEEQLKRICPNGLDLIIDNQSGSTFIMLQSLLKPLGRIVAMGANNLIRDASRISFINAFKFWWNTKHIAVSSLIMNNHVVGGFHLGILADKEPLKVKQALEVLYDFLKKGTISPKIDSIWEIEDIVKATKVLAERRNVGKVLISINK